MNVEKASLNDVLVFSPDVFGDERGFFMETWNKQVFRELGLDADFVQDNHSKSARGILRGLHYQTENVQGKLVRVVSGEVYDVAVDLRESSTTFGQWFGMYLSEENRRILWVPPGFAHGFYVTSDSAEFVYKCTDYYHPQSEVSIRWDDPELAIDWPTAGAEPALSAKDKNGIAFAEAPLFP